MAGTAAANATKSKPRSKPGYKSLQVALTEAHFEKLEKSADGRPLNIWLSKLIERHFDSFKLE
jgi:hypothetical protein